MVILALAIMGVNVFIVLGLGIIIAGAIGLWTMADYSVAQFCQDIYMGFSNMQEIFLLSLLIGGLSAIMSQQGGLVFISARIQAFIHFFTKTHTTQSNEKATELGISGVLA